MCGWQNVVIGWDISSFEVQQERIDCLTAEDGAFCVQGQILGWTDAGLVADVEL